MDCPILSPNSLIFGNDVNFDDAAPQESKSETMKKRHKYEKRCKHEYLVAFREKHNLKHKDKTFKINIGNVVMIKAEEKSRGHILAKTTSFELLNYVLETS